MVVGMLPLCKPYVRIEEGKGIPKTSSMLVLANKVYLLTGLNFSQVIILERGICYDHPGNLQGFDPLGPM